MKKSILWVFLLMSGLIMTQEKYLTKTGSVTFEASVPSFEEVKGVNKNTTAIINTENGEFAALALVKGFRFKNALMEEHFNENYADSDDYPKATFKGKIEGFSLSELNNGTLQKVFNGTLNFHGKTKDIKREELTISKNSDGNIAITGHLKVNVADFDIEIPKIVSNKLSREVDVTFEFMLKKK